MPDFEMPKSRVYVLLDEQGRVTRLEGEYSLPSDLTGWVLLEEGEPCDRLNLAQSHYLDPPLYTEDGLLAWRYVDGALTLRTDEELQAERTAQPAPEPTQADDLAAMTLDHEYRLTLLELGVSEEVE